MMKAIEEGLLFAKSYDFEVLGEIPSGSADLRRFYYPGANEEGGKDGLMVRVDSSNAEPWLGIFASMDHSHTLMMNGIFTCPDADMICVVAGGSGYFVHASMPQWSSEIPMVPITRVLQSTAGGLLVFADFTSLGAWSRDGPVWRTKRLVWDELQVTDYDAEKVVGVGLDPTQPEPVGFVVDVMTGHHEGGSFPDMYEDGIGSRPRRV